MFPIEITLTINLTDVLIFLGITAYLIGYIVVSEMFSRKINYQSVVVTFLWPIAGIFLLLAEPVKRFMSNIMKALTE